MRIDEVLRRATEYLAGKGVESPRLDAEYLLAKALDLTRLELYMHHDRPLSEEERDRFRALVRRRGAREPLAYILGEWGFRRLTLAVDSRALVPRPETEVVVDRCLALLADADAPDILDVGTGTGAIALAIADERPGARVTAIDVSPDALELARANAHAAGLEIRFVQADLDRGFGDAAYDLVVSNPPYVSRDEIETLAPEVRDWEPRLALVDSNQTPKVVEHAYRALRPGGHLVLETAVHQSAHVAELFAGAGFEDVRVTADLPGRDRVVEGRRP